jgi:hypothetical protein
MSVTVTPRILLNASLQSWEAGWVNSPRGFESRILRPLVSKGNASRKSVVRNPVGILAGVRVPAEGLLGRQRERAVLERLLDTARDGHGAVLVVHGEPGVGKAALLEYAVAAGGTFRVVRTAGVEAEVQLDFSGVAAALFADLGVDRSAA